MPYARSVHTPNAFFTANIGITFKKHNPMDGDFKKEVIDRSLEDIKVDFCLLYTSDAADE